MKNIFFVLIFKKIFFFEINTFIFRGCFLPLKVGAFSAEFQQKKAKMSLIITQGVHFPPHGGGWFPPAPLCFSPDFQEKKLSFSEITPPEFTQTFLSKLFQTFPDSAQSQSRFHPAFPFQPKMFSGQIHPRAKQTSTTTKLFHNL